MKPISRLSMLSFPKFDRFEYSEIQEKNIKNRNCKVISLSSEKIPTLHYDLNNCKNSIKAINDNDTNCRVIITENIKLEISSQYNQSNFVSVLNENTNYDSLDNQDNMFDTNNSNLSLLDANDDNMFDTNNSNLSLLDANDNKDDTEDNSHTQNNVQEFENVVTDLIELPRGMSKRLKFIEYYAKLEVLPENEAQAAHELQLKMYFRNTNKKKIPCRCRKCTICDQIVYRNQLTAHKKAHKKIGPNHCSVCFINMRSENSLKEHNVQYHMFKYICRICYEVSFTIINAEAHHKYKHNNNDLGHTLKVDGASITRKSVDCIPKVFTKTPILSDKEKKEIFNQRQLQQHYIDAIFKCGICFKAIQSKELLKKHIPAHTKNKRNTVECSLCRMYFDHKYKLLIHNKREHDYKYTCKDCGEVVYSRMSASKHRSEQHKKVKFLPIATKCKYCNIEFKSKYKLNKHMATHNSVFCYVCGRIFVSKRSVGIHVGVAHEQLYELHMKATYDPDRSSPFYCGECHVQFHNSVAYNRHLTFKEHKDPTPVKCNTKDNQNTIQKKKAINSKVTFFAPRAMNCHLCGEFLSNGKIARAHYKEVHTLAEYYKQIYTTTYKCEQCDYTTMNPYHYKKHVRKHTFSIPCKICGKRFNSSTRLNVHLPGPNHCSVCFINMRSENSLKEHNVQYHMFKYICRICYEVSFTIINAEAHHKYKHNNNDLGHTLKVDGASITRKSVDCIPKVFTKTPILSDKEKKEIFNQRQLQQHYIDAIFKCGICFKAIQSKELLKKHIPAHTKNKRNTVECSLCRMYFDHKYKLLIHNKREHDYKYTCKDCGEVVYSRMSASKHRSEQHKNVKFLPIATKCKYCNIEFKSKYKLNKHMATHNSVFCYVCGRIFVSKRSVGIHVGVAHEQLYELHIKATYDPDRSSQFYCGECHVQFHNAVAYNRHLTFKEHKDPTPVKCNTKDNQNTIQKKKAINSKVTFFAPRAMNCHLCGEFLSNGKIARAHYKEVHTLAEYYKQIYTTTYKCEQCDYTTMNPYHYKKHVRKHTFSIPCKICGKRFNSSTRLNVHLPVHSDETPYECDHCDKKFKTRARAIFHVKNVHLKIPFMPWVRRAERRKREKALERQKRGEESQDKVKNKSRYETKRKGLQQDNIDLNMMNEEQYSAKKYLSHVVFTTPARSGYQWL